MALYYTDKSAATKSFHHTRPTSPSGCGHHRPKCVSTLFTFSAAHTGSHNDNNAQMVVMVAVAELLPTQSPTGRCVQNVPRGKRTPTMRDVQVRADRNADMDTHITTATTRICRPGYRDALTHTLASVCRAFTIEHSTGVCPAYLHLVEAFGANHPCSSVIFSVCMRFAQKRRRRA